MFSNTRIVGKSRKPATAFAIERLEERQLQSASTLTSVAYQTPTGQQAVVFALNKSNQVIENGTINLGFNAHQISAGLDAFGRPEVFAIQATALTNSGEVYVDDNGSGWVDTHEYASQVSADALGVAFAINTNNSVSEYNGSKWSNLGGTVSQISAALNSNGAADVYAIGNYNYVYSYNDANQPAGWQPTVAVPVTQIAASTQGCYAATTSSNEIFIGPNRVTSWIVTTNGITEHPTVVEGYTFSTIGAGVYAAQTCVGETGGIENLYSIDSTGRVDIPASNQSFGGNVSEIAAPALYYAPSSGLYNTGLSGNVVFALSPTGELLEHQNQTWTSLGTGFELAPTGILPRIGPGMSPILLV